MTSRKRGAIGGEEEEVEERPKRVGSSGTAGAGSEKGKGKVKSSRVKSCAECRRLKLKYVGEKAAWGPNELTSMTMM